MLTREENDMLTLVSGDAAMGKLMRQHWTPVCLMEEVAEPDGKPLRVEVLGESYVAFRDSKGRLGMLDELCPHRKASLSMAATKSAACAACITGGRWTWTAMWSRCRPSPRAAR